MAKLTGEDFSDMENTNRIRNIIIDTGALTEETLRLISFIDGKRGINIRAVCTGGGSYKENYKNLKKRRKDGEKIFVSSGEKERKVLGELEKNGGEIFTAVRRIPVYAGYEAVRFYYEEIKALTDGSPDGFQETKKPEIVSGGLAGNLAALLRIAPELSEGIGRIVLSGRKSLKGDPYSAKVILDSGIKTLISTFSEKYALLSLYDEDIFCDIRPENVSVSLTGADKGELLFDRRERRGEPCALIAGGINRKMAKSVMELVNSFAENEKQVGIICKEKSLSEETGGKKNCGAAEGLLKGEEKLPVIMDADTGSDDAIAIMTAALSGKINIRAVCSAWGNSDPAGTAENSAELLSRLGIEVPVYRGLSEPLIKYQEPSRRDKGNLKPITVNGETLYMHTKSLPIDKIDKRHVETLLKDKPAVFFYIDYFSDKKRLKERVKTDIIATAPLSNIALALLLKPEIKENIGRIIIMGGGVEKANITPYSEANFNHDPEAVNVILSSGIKVVIIPLDVTHRVVITEEEIKTLRGFGNFPCALSAELLRQRSLIHEAAQPLCIKKAATVHDAVAVAYALRPDIFDDVRPARLSVSECGESEGRCLIKKIGRDESGGMKGCNCLITFSADREKFAELVIETLKNFK